MRPDDDAVPNAIAGDARKGIRHEWRCFSDRNHAQSFSLDARRDRRFLDSAPDQMLRRRSFKSAARDG
jgi:hypothetical protein